MSSPLKPMTYPGDVRDQFDHFLAGGSPQAEAVERATAETMGEFSTAINLLAEAACCAETGQTPRTEEEVIADLARYMKFAAWTLLVNQEEQGGVR